MSAVQYFNELSNQYPGTPVVSEERDKYLLCKGLAALAKEVENIDRKLRDMEATLQYIRNK